MSILRKIQKEYFQILENLNTDQWGLLINDEWTIKDCIAHFLAWEKLAVENIDNMSGKNFTMGFNDYENFNVIAIKKYKNYSTDKLLSEWKKYQKLLRIKIVKLTKEELKSMAQLFDWIDEDRKNNHYTYHLRQIKNVLKKSKDNC